MIEPTDFLDPGSSSSTPRGDILALRLVELRCSPIHGSFDASHLQNIHHYLYRDLDLWAGELRLDDFGEVERELDKLFDRLASEKHLRGLSEDQWTDQASNYLQELESIRPFRSGNAVTLREFASELARKNRLDLRWENTAELHCGVEASSAALEETRSANLRRLLLLAVDGDGPTLRPIRGEKDSRSISDIFNKFLP